MADLILKNVSLAGVSRCHLRKSLRAKRMRIELRLDRSLLIVIPKDTREDQWLAFVLSKRSWIEESLKRSVGLQVSQLNERTRLPSSIGLLCKQQQYVIRRKSGVRNRAVVDAETLELICKAPSEKQFFQVLRRWLIAQARDEFSLRLNTIAEATGLEWRRLAIRGQKTRWGSCSAQGNLSLNFKLLFLPSDLVNHVLLHELVHTREMNHSPRFWLLLKKLDPKCEQHRRELKTAGQLLPDWTVKI